MKIPVLKENLSGGYEEKKIKHILVARVSLLSRCNPQLVLEKTFKHKRKQ